MKLKILFKRTVIYFILVLAAFLLQTCVFPILTFLSALPNLVLIITFSYGYIYGSTTGIVCGFFAGLLMDLFYPQPFGLFILILSYLGFFSGLFWNQLKNDSIYFPLFLCVVNELLYNLAISAYRFFTLGYADLSYTFKNLVFPETFFSLLVTFVSYRILLYTNRSLDEIDELRGQDVA